MLSTIPSPSCGRFARQFLAAFAFAVPASHAAPVNIATAPGSYTQNFNTLPASGSITFADDSTIPAFYSQRTGTGNTISANSGSSTAGGLYSFGVGIDPERALGTVGSGTPGNFAHGVQLENTSGNAVTINAFGYTGEQWRNSGAAAQTVTLWYKVSNSPISSLEINNTTDWTALPSGDFTSPIAGGTAGALDGNAAANRTPVNLNPSLALGSGQYVMFRWRDIDHSGSDHGLAIDDVAIGWVANATPGIAVSASPAAFAENAGAAASTGTVTIPTALGADLTVDLSSADTTEATVPATVTIPAGQTSATFPIAAIDDFLADGPQVFLITASAAGYLTGQISLTVNDDTDAPLAVSIVPAAFPENAGPAAATGTITLAAATAVDVAVDLTSSDLTEATVPLSVTIPAGMNSVSFAVDAIDDTNQDGSINVTISAVAVDYTSGSTVIQVTDDGDVAPQPTLAPGAIAFTEFDADSTDGLAFVVLAPIAGTDVIYFTDKGWNGMPIGSGGAFGPNEGILKWTAPPAGLAQGTIVYLYGLATTSPVATDGAIEAFGGYNASASGDTIYAYQGDQVVATGFLAIVSTNSDSKANTGLTANNIVQLPNSIDVAAYTGPRATQSTFAGYLPLIADTAANWITQDGSGDQDNDMIAPDFPNNTTPFSLATGGKTYLAYSAANANGQGPAGDFDNDGVSNGVEYFFGETGTGFTANPQVVGGVISYPIDPAATDAAYKVTTSTDLVNWTDVTAMTTLEGGFVKYTLPTGPGKLFVRLEVSIP